MFFSYFLLNDPIWRQGFIKSLEFKKELKNNF